MEGERERRREGKEGEKGEEERRRGGEKERGGGGEEGEEERDLPGPGCLVYGRVVVFCQQGEESGDGVGTCDVEAEDMPAEGRETDCEDAVEAEERKAVRKAQPEPASGGFGALLLCVTRLEEVVRGEEG